MKIIHESEVFEVNPILLTFLGTMFTFLMTALGASVVFLFKKEISPKFQNIFLGFASGVMLAASIWSLLIPALEMAEELGQIEWLVAAIGFIIGGLFLYALDRVLTNLYAKKDDSQGNKRTTLLVSAITMHNIPEGFAVGLSLALANEVGSGATLAGALALTLGIGIQNFPEGAAISLPLRRDGYTKWRAFALGALSGFVEPIAGVLAAILVGSIASLVPWFLSFSAGAMIYVVAQELIPESQSEESPYVGTLGLMIGFLVMMTLDVALG